MLIFLVSYFELENLYIYVLNEFFLLKYLLFHELGGSIMINDM